MNKWTSTEQYKKLYAFVGPRASKLLVLGVAAGLLVFFAELAFSYILQMFLVMMHIAPMSQVNFPSWVPVDNTVLFLSLVSLVIIFRGFTQWLNAYVIAASFEVQRDNFRYRLSEWVLRAESVSSGELLTLYHEGIESVCQVLSSLQTMSVYLSTAVLTFIFLFRLSVKLTLIASFFLVLIGLISRLFDKGTSSQGRIVTGQLEQLNRMLINSVKNLLLVKIYGTQEKERVKIQSKLAAVLDRVLSYQKRLYLRGVLPQVLGIILICALSMVSSQHGWLAPTLALTYFYLFTRGVQNFSEALKLSSMIKFHMPNTVRMAKWWASSAHDGVYVAKVTNSAPAKELPAELPMGWKLNSVSFAYTPESEKILKDFTFEIRAGESLVITGESGSGKSTLISLLLGLQKPLNGTIDLVVGNVAYPLDEVKTQLLHSIGYVGSESFLIEGSILENLLYGIDHLPTDAEVETAIKNAGCEFIHQLGKGLGHRITEQGQGLSAGQKQRLCFARALLRKPRVLILDEATANLDKESEKRFIHTLLQLKNKITIVTVTHREALLSIADKTLHFPVIKE